MWWRLMLVPACTMTFHGMAQDIADTMRLNDVVITAERQHTFGAGVKLQTVDSAVLARHRFTDLGDLLREAGPLFIKSYGLGSLATTSFRGGAAGHTAVVWNGFNLNSAMNGQLDLSLVPAALANDVSIQYGGAGALWGSGAVGGAILLNSRPVFGNGLSLDAATSFGSFADHRQQLGIAFSNDRWCASLRGYRAEAKNDFPFPMGPGGKDGTRRQTNAAFGQYGLISENHYRINRRQRINLMFWLDDAERQVPPTLLQREGTDHQHDRNFRVTTEWQRAGEKTTAYGRAAWFDERLWWYGQESDSGAFSRARTLITEAELRFHLPHRQLLSVGLNNTWAEASADGYPGGQSENHTAFFAAYRYRSTNGRIGSTASARQEAVKGMLVPFTWTLGAEYSVLKGVKAKANVARVYRIPTLNDRYWRPGGDPDLLPESGHSAELGMAAGTRPGAALRFTGEATWFERRMDNWIIWLPNGAYWTPQNLMQVWSRGAEVKGELGWAMGRTVLKLSGMTNYVVSTNERAKATNDASVGKQLIYVPMYSGHGRLGVQRKGLAAAVGMSYTGYRYVSADNRQFLAPYMVADASVSCRMAAGKRTLTSLMLNADNLFDEQYQVMLNRPMPMRNFRLGITVHFQQPLRQNQP